MCRLKLPLHLQQKPGGGGRLSTATGYINRGIAQPLIWGFSGTNWQESYLPTDLSNPWFPDSSCRCDRREQGYGE